MQLPVRQAVSAATAETEGVISCESLAAIAASRAQYLTVTNEKPFGDQCLKRPGVLDNDCYDCLEVERGTATDFAYFTLAWAFFLSAQYFFIRSDTAFRAAADTERLRV